MLRLSKIDSNPSWCCLDPNTIGANYQSSKLAGNFAKRQKSAFFKAKHLFDHEQYHSVSKSTKMSVYTYFF